MAAKQASDSYQSYYVPEQSKWPIIATIGLFTTFYGLGTMMIERQKGLDTGGSWTIFAVGLAIMFFMLFGWFSNVVKESHAGLYSPQMDRSFRWGMSWFIFSEVMFFIAFFGALFYARTFSVPWLGGEGEKGTANMLWPGFEATWPLLSNPSQALFPGPKSTIDPWHIPLLNTVLLVASSITATIAHKALKSGNRGAVKLWLFLTVGLGAVFLGFQVHEYQLAYAEHDLTLKSGIYGTTFFMLTGFHGAHVTLGAIMLTIILLRVMKGHFTAEKHFGFEAACWYWHFVDVVWLCLFVFVYII